MSSLIGQVEHAVDRRRCMFHEGKEEHYIEPNEPCFTIRSKDRKSGYNLCEKAVEEILNEIEDERTMNGDALIT